MGVMPVPPAIMLTLAKRRLRQVLSSGSLKTALTSWSMGVMPVPPAIMLTLASLILRISKNGPDQLEHGGDASPTSNHAHLGSLYLLTLPLLVLLDVEHAPALVD